MNLLANGGNFYYYTFDYTSEASKDFWLAFKVAYLASFAGLDKGISMEEMGLEPTIYPSYPDFCLDKAQKEIPRYMDDPDKVKVFFVTRGSCFDDFSNLAGAAIFIYRCPFVFDRDVRHPTYELDRFGIMPNYHRLGVGSTLLNLAEKTLHWKMIYLATREFQTGHHLYSKTYTEIQYNPETGEKKKGYRYFYKIRF